MRQVFALGNYRLFYLRHYGIPDAHGRHSITHEPRMAKLRAAGYGNQGFRLPLPASLTTPQLRALS
jgi:hypothetical protein